MAAPTADGTDGTGDTGDTAAPRRPVSAWRRLARAGAPRGTKAQLLGAVLALALGFAFATQVQQTQGAGLEGMRQDDLVRVLDDVSQRSTRLDQQARELQAQRDALAGGADNSQAAIDQATQQLDALRILAGTAPAQGPGVRITVTDPDQKVSAVQLIDLLQELRDAGAEVVQFGANRVVASSWIASSGGQLLVDGQPLTRPYIVLAIGDKATLASALNIPGGVVETLRRVNATAAIEQLDSVRIDALQSPRAPRYAQPVPAPSSPATP
jgi:uncharacterized protein YlxW (UPF0749 family)